MATKVKKVKEEKILDLSNPIVQAVLPLKVDAAARAKQNAEETVAACRAELKANEWDMNKVAPYPMGVGGWSAMAAISKYRLYSAITEWDYKKQPGSRNMNGPCTVKMVPARCAKFIETAIKDAEKQYDLFVMKLTEKIGRTTRADLEGNHVWSESILTVTLPAAPGEFREVQKWKTKQIVNVSKLGKLFNQWPTRKLKG
jgi:hypothetical protein